MKVYILVARWLGSSSVDFRVYRTKKVYDLVARQLVSEYRAAEPLEVILVRFDNRAAEPFDANISSKVALHYIMPRMSGSHNFSLACMPHTSALHGLLAPILYTLERKGTSHVAQ